MTDERENSRERILRKIGTEKLIAAYLERLEERGSDGINPEPKHPVIERSGNDVRGVPRRKTGMKKNK